MIAGVAWAQPVGVDGVEVRLDDGAWQPATLSTPINGSTWVQWFLEWDAPVGTHYVTVRATDADGTLQTQERAPIAPDGSTGWQRILLTRHRLTHAGVTVSILPRIAARIESSTRIRGGSS